MQTYQGKRSKAAMCIGSGECPFRFRHGAGMGRYSGMQKIATRVPPGLCDVTQASHPPDQDFEHVAYAAKVGVGRDLHVSPWQANYGLVMLARISHRSMTSGIIVEAWKASTSTWGAFTLFLFPTHSPPDVKTGRGTPRWLCALQTLDEFLSCFLRV
jgi:hypothetical protein